MVTTGCAPSGTASEAAQMWHWREEWGVGKAGLCLRCESRDQKEYPFLSSFTTISIIDLHSIGGIKGLGTAWYSTEFLKTPALRAERCHSRG